MTPEELILIDESQAIEAITNDVSYILTGLSEVSVERAHTYYAALAKKMEELDDLNEAIEELHTDKTMEDINADLYSEVYNRMEIPTNPDQVLIERLSEGWDEGLEMVIRCGWMS